jgi:hypothetical protein
MTLRFSIPRRVARVVDFSDVEQRARESGVSEPRIVHGDRHVDWTRVICSRETAVFLVQALQRVAAGAEQVGDRDLADAARLAVATVLSEKDVP